MTLSDISAADFLVAMNESRTADIDHATTDKGQDTATISELTPFQAKMVYFAHLHCIYPDHHNNVRGMFDPMPNNTLIPRAPVRRDPGTNRIVQESTFLPDTIYKLEQVPEHLQPSVGKGMVFADDNQYLNGGVHAIMSTSGQPVALYEQYIITGLKCDERAHARNLNDHSLSMPIGTTHMAMALPTYGKADCNGHVHDLVVDISGFDTETGTVSPEVVGRIIETYNKIEPDDYGVNIPTTKYMVHWLDGRYRECRRESFRIILHVSWVSMKGGQQLW